MPGGFFLWSLLLCLVLVSHTFASALPELVQASGPYRLARPCQFAWTIPNPGRQQGHRVWYLYDLCPLIDPEASKQLAERNVDEEGNEQSTTIQYQFDFTDSRGWVDDEQCLERGRVCFSPPIDQAPPFAFVRGRGTNSGSAAFSQIRHSKLNHDEVPEFLVLHLRGIAAYSMHLAQIFFQCDASVPDSSSPVFLRARQDHRYIHEFMWNSRHACPRSYHSDKPPLLEVNTVLGESPNWTSEPSSVTDNGEEGTGDSNEEHDLVDPPIIRKRSDMTKILIIIGASIAVVCTVIISRPSLLPDRARRLLFAPIAKSRHTKFRVDERRLVRWAQEDAALDGPEGEEDEMVNSVDSGYNTDDYMDAFKGSEYIPLKPSPRMGSGRTGSLSFSGYGSVHNALLDGV